MGNGTEVRVPVLPACDLCTDGTLAAFDAKTKQGPWANLCRKHFDEWGIGVGLGMGQHLIVAVADGA